MTFISSTFAIFFAIFCALYFLAAELRNKGLSFQRILLLAASLTFYAFADLRFLPFLFYALALSYFGGLSFCIGGGHKRIRLFALVAASLAPLLFFKYSPIEWRRGIVFPLGLSFFTFQSISYIVDCYKNKIEAERNFITVAQFISFFPVISSGPIQRANNLIPQLKTTRQFEYNNATDGMKLFAWGILKKIYVADKIALYVNCVYESPADQHGLALLLATILYSFQIYCDFSGYSDMAIGAARILGFDVGRNFDHPYLSQSIGEFWRRWHISLSSWLKDYVYIPLGGSRVALPRIYLNLLITFLVSGIWHGSTWNFVIWGLLHGLYQCAGRTSKPLFEKIKLPSFIKIFFTFCLVTFAWIFFRAKGLKEAFAVIQGFGKIPMELARFISQENPTGFKDTLKELFALNNSSFGYLSGMMIVLATTAGFAIISAATQKKEGLKIIKTLPLLLRWCIYIVLTVIIWEASTSSVNFIYQNF